MTFLEWTLSAIFPCFVSLRRAETYRQSAVALVYCFSISLSEKVTLFKCKSNGFHQGSHTRIYFSDDANLGTSEDSEPSNSNTEMVATTDSGSNGGSFCIRLLDTKDQFFTIIAFSRLSKHLPLELSSSVLVTCVHLQFHVVKVHGRASDESATNLF